MRNKLIAGYLFLVIIFCGCNKDEPLNFRLYDLNIYSLPIDEAGISQEVYVSVKVEGFKVLKEDDNYKFHIDLSADLITPENRTISSITRSDSIATQSEKFGKYLNLELSFVLDSTFHKGNYILILHGTDKLGDQHSEIKEEFKLD